MQLILGKVKFGINCFCTDSMQNESNSNKICTKQIECLRVLYSTEAYGELVFCSSPSVCAIEKNCKPTLVANQSRLYSYFK